MKYAVDTHRTRDEKSATDKTIGAHHRSTIRICSTQSRCACSWHQRHQRSQVLTTINEPHKYAHLPKTKHQFIRKCRLCTLLGCLYPFHAREPQYKLIVYKHSTPSPSCVCGWGVAQTVFMGVYKSDVTHAAYAWLCGNDESNQCARSETEYTKEGFTFSRNGRARKPASSAAAHTHQQTVE